MEKQKDKVDVTAHIPISFPRWREVLHSEISDLSNWIRFVLNGAFDNTSSNWKDRMRV